MTKTILRLGYRHFYDENHKPSYSEATEQISSHVLIQLVSLFSGKVFLKETDIKLQFEIFKKLIVSLDSPERERLFQLGQLYLNKNALFIFNSVTNLKILEKELQRGRILNEEINNNNIQTESAFKAYLIMNDELESEEKSVFDVNAKQPDDELLDFALRFLMPAHLPYFEFHYKSDLLKQLLIAYNFFNFCESDTEFKNYLRIFLDRHGCKTWKEYLAKVLEPVVLYFKMASEEKNILKFSKRESLPQFLRNWTGTSEDFKKQREGRYSDFLPMRNKPLFEIKENDFLVLYLPFLLDKIFQSLKFSFTRIIANHLKEISQSKNEFENLMSNISSKFSHPYFASVAKSCFDSPKTVIKSGDEIDELVDLFLRNNDCLFLFEFKDETIPVTTKCSDNFNTIKAGVWEKFVLNRQNKKKGVTQLADAILYFNSHLNEYDKFDISKLNVFPILVYTDFTLNFPGFNYLLNKEFNRQLNNSHTHKFKFKRINDLVLMDFKILVEYKDQFSTGLIDLKKLLVKYYEEENKRKSRFKYIAGNPDKVLDQFSSCSKIIESEIYKRSSTESVPEELSKLIGDIFPA